MLTVGALAVIRFVNLAHGFERNSFSAAD